MMNMATKKDTKKKAAPKEKQMPEEKTEVSKEVLTVEGTVSPSVEAKALDVPKVQEKSAPKTEDKKTASKAKKATKKAAKKKTTEKIVITRGKRKEAVARATIKPGTGTIRLNRKSIESINNIYVREIIREPLRYIGSQANTISIKVNVFGGGSMGQAQAARTAIAKGLDEYFADMNLKEKFSAIDRSLLVEDTRRVEPKKFGGAKARARRQKSYR